MFKHMFNILYKKNTALFEIEVDLSSHHTVKPHPEAHMNMILFEVCLKNIHLTPQDQIIQ